MKTGWLKVVSCIGLICAWAVLPSVGEAQTAASALFRAKLLQRDPLWSPEVSLGAPSSTQPTAELSAGMGEWTRVAYQAFVGDNWEIVVGRSDWSQPTRVTNHPASDTRPRLDRGVTRVAFQSNRDTRTAIYAMGIDGSDLRRLTSPEADSVGPAWSPDGGRIAFASNRDGNWEIYVMDRDGSRQTRLTSDPAEDAGPAWSPDGSRIAWVRRTGSNGVLWAMNANGTGARPLTGDLPFAGSPAWSPDGRLIAIDYDNDNDYWNELATVSADGGSVQEVVDPSRQDAITALVDAQLGSWSPDGIYLVYGLVSYVIQDEELYIGSAYVERVSFSSGAVTRLSSSGVDMRPDWQSLDAQPPTVSVGPLGAYTHLQGFTLSWRGQDVGPSGIRGYEVQYREGAGQPWTSWLKDTLETSRSFIGIPGRTFGFRARACDQAWNCQAWRGDQADTSTTFYSWQLQGSTFDARGAPLPGVSVSADPAGLDPIRSNVAGRYHGYMLQDMAHALQVSREGYGATPPMYVTLLSDTVADHWLPPADEVVQDGHFESSSLGQAWVPFGDPLPTRTSEWRHTGEYSLQMGRSFEQTTDILQDAGWLHLLGADQAGTLYLLAVVNRPDGRRDLAYRTKTPEGAWSASSAFLTLAGAPQNWSFVPDGDGGLHVAWSWRTPSGAIDLYYCQKAADSSTCTPVHLVSLQAGYASYPSLALDEHKGLHLVYRYEPADGPASLRYVHKPYGGDWAPTETISADGWHPSIAAWGGRVHIAYGDPDASFSAHALSYISRTTAGAWTAPVVLDTASQWPSPVLRADLAGNLHLLWGDARKFVRYAFRPQTGGWSAPVQLSRPGETLEYLKYQLGVDAGGRAHVFYSNGTRLLYTVREASGEWWRAAPTVDAGGNLTQLTMAVTPQGLLQAIWRSFADPSTQVRHTHPLVAEADTSSGASQVVHLPEDLEQATVSLLYRAESPVPLRVTVNDGASETSVVDRKVFAEGWEHAWADVSAWSGQTVTVTVALEFAAGQPWGRVTIDEVSLGSWPGAMTRLVTLPLLLK